MKNNLQKTAACVFILMSILLSFTTHAQVADINTIAGNGTGGFSGDGAAATAAQLNTDMGVAVDDTGNIYIADAANNRIRKVNTSGVISTFAGSGGGGFGGGGGFSGDGGQATAARLNHPEGVAVDNSGNVYIADYNNNRIREVNTSGVINTIAGSGTGGFGGGGSQGFSGDGGQATAAKLNHPTGVAVDDSGNVFIADNGNNVIRKINTTGVINTFAGSSAGTGGFNGNGGPATAAVLNAPTGVAVDKAGNVYIADQGNNMIREVFTSDTINTIAGTGTNGFSGDGAAATAAEINQPFGIAVDDSGNIYIGDENNSRIRKINFAGIINTVAGDGTAGFSGDGGPATAAEINVPAGVAVDDSGDIFIADVGNNRVRAVYTAYAPVANFTADSVACINTPIQFTDKSFSSISNKPTSWHWTFTNGTPATSTVENPTVTYAALGSNTVKLVVSNAAGADSITKSNYITINPLPTVSVSPKTDTLCTGHALALDGNGALTYTWAPANGLSATTGSLVVATPSFATTYTVTGTDVNGCKNTATVALTVKPGPIVTATPSANPICNGYPVTLTAKSGIGTTYTWFPSGALSSTTGSSVVANPTAATTYSVVGIDTTDGCADTANIAINIYGAAAFSYVVKGYELTLSMDSLSSCATGGYQWNYGNGVTNTESTSPAYTYPSDTAVYTVCLRCSKDSSCPQCINISLPGNYNGNTATGINLVKDNNKTINVIPNPNNGVFTLSLENITGNQTLEIFNILGQQICQSATVKNTTQINLVNQPEGVYFIYLKSDDGVIVKKISITK